MGEIVSCPRCQRCQHSSESSGDTFGTDAPTLPVDGSIPEAIIQDQIAAKKIGRLRQWLASISG